MKRTKPANQSSPAPRESSIPKAIIRWPQGLSGPAVIYPMGENETENERIRKVVKKALAK